jgi:cytochrome P450
MYAGVMQGALPPGPRLPKTLQTIGWWTRSGPFFERCRARYGKRFTVRLLSSPPFVHLSDPDEVKEVFKAPPEVLHPGEGASVLEPIVGTHSVILLDEGAHLSQRKLMLPAFHGEKMQRLSGLMAEVADREVARWPRGEAVVLHPRLQALTLEIILRAVFGLDPGPRLDALRERLTGVLEVGESPASMLPFLQRGRRWRAFERERDESDALLFELIDERRRQDGDRDDVLAMLLEARHEDGSPMPPQELRDELMTLLVAGHETTASSLAWAVERLVRHPEALARLREETDAGQSDYADAVCKETLRLRPILSLVVRRLKEPMEIGGHPLPAGITVAPCIYLVHRRPDVYADPLAFRPERFLEAGAGTYTWFPFGGGVRRCLGASFALFEMRIVLRELVARLDLRAADPRPERFVRRAITNAPRRGGEVVAERRATVEAPSFAAAA